jgi:hypothetical protein
MTPLGPELEAIVLALGLALALGCYLVSNLSPGGMITPGWIALGLLQDERHGLVVIAVVLATYVAARVALRLVILYGKRLFVSVLVLGVFFSLTAFLFLSDRAPALTETSTIGFIVPGLVVYQLIRQPAAPTLVAASAVAALTYAIVLTGVVFKLVPAGKESDTADVVPAPPLESVPAQLVLALLVGAVALGLLWTWTRRLEPGPLATAFRRVQPPLAFAFAGGALGSGELVYDQRVTGRAADDSEWDFATLARIAAELPVDDRERLRRYLEDTTPRDREPILAGR